MLAQDRRPALRLIVEELRISKDTAHSIVRDDLSKRKICAVQSHRRAEIKTDGNIWRLHFHVWPGSIGSGKHRHGRWDLVLPVRSEMKAAIDGVVITDFPATKKTIQRCTFCGRECKQRFVTAVLRSIPQEAYVHLCTYIWGFRARQHLRSLVPVMNDDWW